jgi:hypothetical protein
MGSFFGFRSLLAMLAIIALAAAFAAVRLTATDRPVPPNARVITISSATRGRPVQAGFVGFSFEYPAVIAYAGGNPRAVNPVLVQLIRNLAPRQSPELRIGGDSADAAWWPVAHDAAPSGIRFSITRRWLAVTAALARATGARMMLGIDFEADSRALARAEARAIVAGIGQRRIEALELGNEPELYSSFAYFHAPDGRKVPGRPRGYDPAAFVRDYTRIASALPPVPLGGPAIGAPGWMHQLPAFLAAEPRVGVVTLHRYPLQRCYTPKRSPQYPTIAHLLAPSSSAGLANSVARYARLAHAHHVPLRIDEMNSVSCAGKRGVSDVFASALWWLDALFGMARVGVDGINLHTFPGGIYQPFTFKRVHGRWQAFVEPEYYGLMMFAQAAPPGSRLLRLSGGTKSLRVWATRAPDGRIRVVVINDSPSQTEQLAIKAPSGAGSATLERLEAPGLGAHHHVTLGGQSFGTNTTTGLLAGPQRVEWIAPIGRDYVVTVAPATAALLTIAPS